MKQTVEECEFSRKSKTYKVNYFAGLGELFKNLDKDKDVDNGRSNPVDTLPGREGTETTR